MKQFTFMSEHAGKMRVLAGGTDLIPSMRQKLFEPEYVLDLRGVSTDARHPSSPRWRRRNRGADHASCCRALRILAAALSCADRSCRNRRLAHPAQHGHAWRQHLPRHALPLVQPVAHLAQGLRILHQERRRPLPRRSRWNQVLGGVLRRHASSIALPERRNRNCQRCRNASHPTARFLYRPRRRLSQAPAERISHAYFPPGRGGRLPRRSTASCEFEDRSITLSPESRS